MLQTANNKTIPDHRTVMPEYGKGCVCMGGIRKISHGGKQFP